MNSIASIEDRIRAKREEQIAALELDIALWSATVALIHEGWKLPEFRAAFEHHTASDIHATVSAVLREMKVTADGAPVPITKVLEAISAIPYDD